MLPTPTSQTSPRDSDLGVPPFRPASKEAPAAMPSPPRPNPNPPAAGAPPRPVPLPQPRPAARPDANERRTLVVGRGISLQGTVTDAERLVVEGTVESQMIHAAELFVAPSGVFKGEVGVEDAEIAGVFDGTVTARGSLVVKSTGRVSGVARCRRLSVEDGGQISGRMEMLTDGGMPTMPAPPGGMPSMSPSNGGPPMSPAGGTLTMSPHDPADA